MTLTAIILSALLAALAVALAAVLLLTRDPSPKAGTSRSVPGGNGSWPVTVRRAGGVTSIDIPDGILDHWEGDAGVTLPPLPIEVTRRERPGLYAEFVSASTPAGRRHEIADELYSQGFTLPWIPEPDRQFREEKKDAPNDSGGGRRIPVDLTRNKDNTTTI